MTRESVLIRPSNLNRQPLALPATGTDPLRSRAQWMNERRPDVNRNSAPLFDDTDREGCERMLRRRTACEVSVVRIMVWDLDE